MPDRATRLSALLAEDAAPSAATPAKRADRVAAILNTPEAGEGEWAWHNVKEGVRDVVNLPTDTLMSVGSVFGSETAQEYLMARREEQAAREQEMLAGRMAPSTARGEVFGAAARSAPMAVPGVGLGGMAARRGASALATSAIGALPGAATTTAATTGNALVQGADPTMANVRGFAAGGLEVLGEVVPIPGLGRGADVALARALGGGSPGQSVRDAIVRGGKDVAAGMGQEAWVNPAQSGVEAALGGAPVTLESLIHDAKVGALSAGVLGAPMAVAAGGMGVMAQQKQAAERQKAIEAQIARREAAKAQAGTDAMVAGLADTLDAGAAQEAADAAEALRWERAPAAVEQQRLDAEAEDMAYAVAEREAIQDEGPVLQPWEGDPPDDTPQAALTEREAKHQIRLEKAQAAAEAQSEKRSQREAERTLAAQAAEQEAEADYDREERLAIQDENTKAEMEAARIDARLEKAQAAAEAQSEKRSQREAERTLAAQVAEMEAEQVAVQEDEAQIPEPEALSPEQRNTLLANGYTRKQLRNIKPALADRIIATKGFATVVENVPAPRPPKAPTAPTAPRQISEAEIDARLASGEPTPAAKAESEASRAANPSDAPAVPAVVPEARVEPAPRATAESPAAAEAPTSPSTVATRTGATTEADTPRVVGKAQPAVDGPAKREQAWREKRSRLQAERQEKKGRFTAEGPKGSTLRGKHEGRNVADIDDLTEAFGPAPSVHPITDPAQVPKPHPFYHFRDWFDSLPEAALAEIGTAAKQGKEAKYAAQAKWGWTKEHSRAADFGRKHEINEKGMVRMQADPLTGRAEARDTPAFQELAEIAYKHYGNDLRSGEQQTIFQKPTTPRAMTTDDVKDMPAVDPLDYSPEQHAITQAIKATGGSVRIVEGLRTAGAWGVYWFDGKPQVLIDSKATGAQLVSAAAHEATHLAYDALTPDAQRATWDAVTASVGPENMVRLEAETRVRHKGEDLDENQLRHEVLASIGERLDLVKIADHAPGFVEKVLEILSDMLRNLVARFKGDARTRAEPIIREMLRRQIAAREAVLMQWAAGPNLGNVLGMRRMPVGVSESPTDDLGDKWAASTVDLSDTVAKAVVDRVVSPGAFEKVSRAWFKYTNDILRVAQEHPEMWTVYNGVREATGRASRVTEDVHVAGRDLTRASPVDLKTASDALHAADGTGGMADTTGMTDGARKAVEAFYRARDVMLRNKAAQLWQTINGETVEEGQEFDTSQLDYTVDEYDQRLAMAEADIQAFRAAGDKAAEEEAKEARDVVKAEAADIAAMRRLSGLIREIAALNESGYIPHYWMDQARVVLVKDAAGNVLDRRTADSAEATNALVAEMEAEHPGMHVKAVRAADHPGEAVGQSNRMREDIPILTGALGLTPEQVTALEDAVAALYPPAQGRTGVAGYIEDMPVVLARMAGAAGHAASRVILDGDVKATIDSFHPDKYAQAAADRRAKQKKSRVQLAVATGEMDAAEAQQHMHGIDATRNAEKSGDRPNLEAYARRYVQEATSGNNALIQAGRWMANVMYLGFRASSALTQTVQPLAQTIPWAVNFGGGAAYTAIREARSVLRIMKLNETAQFFRSRAEIDTVLRKMFKDSGDPALEAALVDNLKRGRNFELPSEAEFKDLEAAARGEAPGKVRKAATQVAEKSMAFFAANDMAVRVSAYRTGWKIANGMGRDGWNTAKHLGYHGRQTPEAFAEWFTDRTAFVMGKANQAQAHRTATGQLLTSLKSYVANVINVYRAMRSGRAKARAEGDAVSLGRQRAALATQLIAHTLISGPSAAGPLIGLATLGANLVAAVAAAFGDDRDRPWTWQTEVYRRLGQDSTWAKAIDQGVPGMADMGNLGKRLSWSAGAIPEKSSIFDVAAPASVGKDIVGAAAKTVGAFDNPARTPGQATGDALKALLTIPRVGQDVAKAVQIGKGLGVTSKTGKATGATSDYGGGSVAATALGFQTGTEYRARVAQGVNAAVARGDKAQTKFAQALATAIQTGDMAEKEAILSRMRTYNIGRPRNEQVSTADALEFARKRKKMAQYGAEDVQFAPRDDREAIRATLTED